MFGYDCWNRMMRKPSIKIEGLILFLAAFVIGMLVGCQPSIPTITEVRTPTATLSEIQAARQILDDYYTALIHRNYETAAALYTSRIGINRSDLLQLWEDNDHQGWRLIGYEITDQQPYGETRIVFWVRLTQEGSGPSQFDTINVLHLEDSGWRVGNSTLDKIAIQDRPHSNNNVTVLAGVFFRYVDGYAIWFHIENGSSNAVIWGREGEGCGRLSFAAFTVQSSCSSPIQILPGQEANLSLVFLDDVLSRPPDEFPARLEISMFLWDADHDGLADSQAQAWSYQLELQYDLPNFP